jgi:hypothetical protein
VSELHPAVCEAAGLGSEWFDQPEDRTSDELLGRGIVARHFHPTGGASVADQQRTKPVTITDALTRATLLIEWAQSEDPGAKADHLLTIAEAWQSLASTIHDVTTDD